jgi:APA family basic amino acid/polyamine antiporter
VPDEVAQQSQDRLARRLGLGDAVFIGLGSMIGAGVFVAAGPAARAAGTGLLIGLAVAAVVAYCNATSSAQLAAAYPRAGGTYLYGREVLGPWWGFVAGWGFLVGKVASAAAMAMTFAAYAAPGAERPVAATVVVVLTLVNCSGVTRTALLTRIIVTLVLAGLAVVVGVCVHAGSTGRLAGWASPDHGAYGVLQAAGFLFFAFAGYARIATLGEEVRDPARVIPRAIVGALALAVVVYGLVAVAALMVLGPEGLARSAAPLADAVRATSATWALPVVRIAAALAAAGALLALVAGLGRTALAMARERDLPAYLAAVHRRFGTPHRAELAAGAAVLALVLTVDVRGAIGFSSFGVLVYYLVANVAAHRQDAGERRFPRALQVLGAGGCVLLVATLPPSAVAAGLAVLAAGVVVRVARLRSRRVARNGDLRP